MQLKRNKNQGRQKHMKFLGLYRSEGFHNMSSSPWGKSFTKEETKSIKMNAIFAPLHAEQGKTETSAGFILT